jgi:hypothetical protein
MQELRSGANFTGSVLNVMLSRGSDEEDNQIDQRVSRELLGPASSVAELLQTAPYTVPYRLRVDMFRQLLQMDKVLASQCCILLTFSAVCGDMSQAP